VATPAQRKSAQERREETLAVALRHFAIGGYHGTSTEVIAREAGISQPYLFRLFRTKKELFLDCYDRGCGRVRDVFRTAAAGAAPGEELRAMGHAYVAELLPDRHAVLMMMQGFAASADREIQAYVRASYGAVVNEVAALAGRDPGEVWDFFATGMLLNIVAALDLEDIADEAAWAAAWTRHFED
jgi:AcrR family transcriptional regulator